MRMGLPKRLTTDQGSEFKNHLLKEMMDKFNTKHIFATAYHPQVNNTDVYACAFTMYATVF